MSPTPDAVPSGISSRDPSFAGACASWFRQLARALKTGRLYRDKNPMALKARDEVIDLLENLLVEHRGWNLRFTPTELLLDDDVVIRPRAVNEKLANLVSAEEKLPFAFYRDGIRGMRIRPGIPRRESEAFIDALAESGWGTTSHDDLLTLLWQANLTHIEIDSVPLEQTIVLSEVATGDQAQSVGPAYVQVDRSAEMREQAADMAAALHHDHDDWALPDSTVDVGMAYALLSGTHSAERERLLKEWQQENAIAWGDSVRGILKLMIELDPNQRTREPVCHATASWLGTSIRRGEWVEAKRSMELFLELDPESTRLDIELERVLSNLNHPELAELLDEAGPDEHSAFAALAVALGRHGVELTFGILSHAAKTRTHAAASTALCYQCADDPELLAGYVGDPRPDVVQHLAFVLGQIGGPEVLSMLQIIARHPEPRVRRQAIQALGGVPEKNRLRVLADELCSLDPQVLAATLSLLTRSRNPQVASMLLALLDDPSMKNESQDTQRMLFQALGEVADDESVPALKAMVNKGWMFARASFARQSAAHALQRIGTAKARSVLAEGMQSWNAAVRRACLEAMDETIDEKEAA